MTIRDKIKQLQSIDVNALTDAAILDNEAAFLEANRTQLYDHGIVDVTKPDRRESYAESTKKRKRKTAKFPKTDFITLKWSGVLHESFKLFILKDFIAIRPMDIKWGLYIQDNERFGNAMGLTAENLSAIRDKIKVSFLNIMRNEL